MQIGVLLVYTESSQLMHLKQVFCEFIAQFFFKKKMHYVKFQRRQFPIYVSYAMTINKSQGQSLKNVEIYLPESCVLAWSVVRCNFQSHFKTRFENTNR